MHKTSGFSKYDRKEFVQSNYCYEDSEILINKMNIRNAKRLAAYEADITLVRQYELEHEQPLRGRFGITHLKKIHKYIFQDIYPFAGKFRTENIYKGSTEFCKSQFIQENLEKLFKELAEDKYLKDLDVNKFSYKVAYYLAELNLIHPFREGNGRSLREYVRQLAQVCGFTINWALIDKETLLTATIASVAKDYEPLRKCVLRVIESK